jgi:hypothetical protein
MARMPIDAADPLPTPRPATRHGQLEVDAFCTCGYNLHGQLVSLDERLGFPICRCPECGRYHPAGAGVTSRSLWLHRFAASLLALWVLVVLVICFLVTLAMAGMQGASVDDFTYQSFISPDGRPVTAGMLPNGRGYGYVITGTNIVVTNPILRRTTVRPPDFTTLFMHSNNNRDLEMFILISSLLGFLLGILLVTFLWHWPRWRYIGAMLFPIIASGFTFFSFLTDDSYHPIRNWVIGRLLMMLAIQCAAVLLGVLLGRKISRTIARSIIPPKPRQMLAFLWIADGKLPPSIPQPKN